MHTRNSNKRFFTDEKDARMYDAWLECDLPIERVLTGVVGPDAIPGEIPEPVLQALEDRPDVSAEQVQELRILSSSQKVPLGSLRPFDELIEVGAAVEEPGFYDTNILELSEKGKDLIGEVGDPAAAASLVLLGTITSLLLVEIKMLRREVERAADHHMHLAGEVDDISGEMRERFQQVEDRLERVEGFLIIED